MKFMVGLQTDNPDFIDYIIENKDHIYEVYFSFGDFPSGRNRQTQGEKLPFQLQNAQIDALKKLSAAKIPFNLLLNANCYGKDSLSRWLFTKIGDTADYILTNFGLASVTTTSPLIGKFFHENFNELEVRASVNMGIGENIAMDYVKDYFDSFYLKREYNRDIEAVKRAKKWCDENGKKLFLLGNSGCLNHCSAHTFHDNLVAHEAELAQMDNAYRFHGICHEYLKDENHLQALITNTNFIRPEDVSLYEGLTPAIKLATRVHSHPESVVNAYINKGYSGDILKILEPAHSIYPYALENGEPLKIVKIDGIGEIT